jgi:hypothetical protein
MGVLGLNLSVNSMKSAGSGRSFAPNTGRPLGIGRRSLPIILNLVDDIGAKFNFLYDQFRGKKKWYEVCLGKNWKKAVIERYEFKKLK